MYGHVSFNINIVLMMLSGFFVNGPYALITTAVSADLGTHESLQGNAKALATVTAIIDGMGSIGAALGPMMTGYISDIGGFDLVFAMLYFSAIAAGMLIIKLAAKEVRRGACCCLSLGRACCRAAGLPARCLRRGADAGAGARPAAPSRAAPNDAGAHAAVGAELVRHPAPPHALQALRGRRRLGHTRLSVGGSNRQVMWIGGHVRLVSRVSMVHLSE
jgi:MFS family permease